MATAQNFDDLHVWQDARQLVRERKGFRRDFSLRDQVTRAAASTMSTIAEGFERGTRKEFVQFLNIAKGSVGEVRSQLYVALDQEYFDQKTFEALKISCIALSRPLARFISYLKRYPTNARVRADDTKRRS